MSIAGWRIHVEFERWRVHCRSCRGVFVERLDWLAKNPRYTLRFALHVGDLCRDSTNKAVALREHLHHSTVKDLDKLYIARQVARAGRPIWVGGEGRKEKDLDRFFAEWGPKKTRRIELAAMDMWRPFRNSVTKNVPGVRIVYDKFHIVRHLLDAMDEVRRSEYRRLAGRERSYIKGQRYTLLSHRENLTLEGRRALRKLLKANRRINTAYLLKETFDQLWDYNSESWALTFFRRWRQALRWQRIKPFEKFAVMIEEHWDGIASYCNPENKISLGMVEGLNTKIRVLQRRAYGYRDEEYFKLKIIAAFLPPLGRNAANDPL